MHALDRVPLSHKEHSAIMKRAWDFWKGLPFDAKEVIIEEGWHAIAPEALDAGVKRWALSRVIDKWMRYYEEMEALDG